MVADEARIIPAYAGSTPLRPPPSFPPRDHPRIRGEHRRWRVSSRPNPGSSPHTRGAQGFRYAHSTFCRIIPAYAGSTSCANGTSNTPADHPRIRGEHLGYRWDAEAKLGSSPHTRGAQPDFAQRTRLLSIIPAYAGSTVFDFEDYGTGGDHPRIRGEHDKDQHTQAMIMGSSPHTRGAPAGATAPPDPSGIIPAYAGSTVQHAQIGSSIADHPRIRGEHLAEAHGFGLPGGSSPHTRGAPALPRLVVVVDGIIPAYAGSTWICRWRRPPSRDHPRIRGEHSSRKMTQASRAGSSPHTRGARLLYYDTDSVIRIIPAYAGSTRQPASATGYVPDHPRIRGEHAAPPGTILQTRGSSPHTRGAPPGGSSRLWRGRIIPAYAGSTRGRP